ncbi:MAG: MSCRAMM family adhesin SdrC [Myxococcota bacterium]|nr:MSCRAMM family adhesin SdrC [Myxococcota bacterium]
MTRALGCLVLASLLASSLVACGDTTVRPRRDGGDAEVVSLADEDGDGISDFDEGRAEDRDTDGDGTPDYLDDDSDGDGISDADEAGDDNPASAPIDSDSDGAPDFIDTDSDNNGILDIEETPGDIDGDGRPNYADPDDDGDLLSDVRELRGMVSPPADSDADGLPDYHDPDSDNDTINDGHDGDADTDMDGTPDFLDTDSDEDGILDSVEAGDTDLATPPVDTDEDTIPDFRDPDSDGDGLSDREEAADHGTSPTSADTDGDGVSDLIEVAAGSDPTNMADSPRTRGDFVFTVPYMEPPDPTRDTLSFRTSIQFADIYFLFDASASMGGEQDNLAAGVSTIISNLTCADTGTACMRDSDCAAGNVCSPFTTTCIEDPSTSSCILSAWTGAGQYGQSAGSGNLLINRTSLQPDPAVTRAGIDLIPEDGGTEPLYAAVWNVVDPAGSPQPEMGCAPAMAGRIGCPAYREEAVRILVAFTDEDSDGTATAAQAGGALMTTAVTFIGVSSGAAARSDLVDLAVASDSLSGAGVPLVFDASATGTGIETVVTDAINEIVEGVPLRVTIEATDEPGDAGDSLQFIRHLETNTTAAECAMVPTEDTDADGFPDAFPMVTPGTRVCWDVVPEMNTTVMPTASPQIFRALLTVRGDGSPLDSRQVFFLVPPMPPVIGGPS